jgi:hypothetical protein
MGINVFPVTPPKTRRVVTLNSGTSWTVPTGVTYVNATLIGGGGGGGSVDTTVLAQDGLGGQIITTLVTTTPGASITYAIGAGGTSAASGGNQGGTGGTTTFTGATSALGGIGGGWRGTTGTTARDGLVNMNVGKSAGLNSQASGAGGAGQIVIEYWS